MNQGWVHSHVRIIRIFWIHHCSYATVVPNSSESRWQSKTQEAQYLFACEAKAADEIRMKWIFDNTDDIASLSDADKIILRAQMKKNEKTFL